MRMERIKSWRWSRLLETEAIKRVDSKEVKISLVIFVATFCAVVFIFNWSHLAFYLTIFYLIYILGKICIADAFYEVEKKGTNDYVLLYVYKIKDNLYNLYIKDHKDSFNLRMNNFEWIIHSNQNGWFILCYNDYWYYQDGTETVLLGKRIGKLMFITPHKNDKIMLKILRSKGCLISKIVDKIFYEQDIMHIPELDFYSQDDTDYALIKQDGEYKLISTIYTSYGDKGILFFSYERYKSVIFIEDGKTVIATWNDKDKAYHIIYRKTNLVNSFQTFVDAKNNQLPTDCTIYKFGTRYKDISIIYKGQILGIDEEKRILFGETEKARFAY